MRRFTIYSTFFYIKKSIFWCQEVDFLMSRSRIFYIKNIFDIWERNKRMDLQVILRYLEQVSYLLFIGLCWYQTIFLDIKTSIFWYKKIDVLIQKISPIFYIKNSIFYIKRSFLDQK